MSKDGPRARKDVVTSKLGCETMLYDPASDRLHVLNEAASLVWVMADGSHTACEMAEGLRRALAVPAQAPVERDIRGLLDDFAEKGLLEGEC